MEKRIKNIFIIRFLKIGTVAVLGVLVVFIALFTLEVKGQKEVYLESSKREVSNLQENLISQMDYMIRWINFYSRSRALLSIYEGDEEGREYIYNHFKGWVDKDVVLTAIVLYDKDGEKVLGYSAEKGEEKKRNFLKIKDNIIKEIKKDEYRIVNKLTKERDNTYFLHFIPIYDGEELKGYLTAVGNLKNLMMQYEKSYKKESTDNIMGFLRIADGDRVEGVLLNEEKMRLELFKSGFERKEGYMVTGSGDYMVLSKNIKCMLQRTEALKEYQVRYDDGNAASASVIILKREQIMEMIGEIAIKYLNFFMFSAMVILGVLYRHLKLAFENDLGKRRLRVKARKLDKNISAINTVVSVVGHDIKGPFTSLLSGFSLISQKRERMGEKQLTTYLTLMEEECRKACHFSENLMKWAISQNGLYSYTPSEVDLYKLAQNQIEEYRGMARLKEIEMEIDISKDLICYSDKDILKTIIRNLIINAIKFTSSKGRIRIEAKEEKGIIELIVEDTGMGMSGDVLQMIEKETVYSSKGSTGEIGNGMGLILIKRLSRINMGSMKIQSDLGKGTRIKIDIPKKKRNSSMEEEIGKQEKKILIWD